MRKLEKSDKFFIQKLRTSLRQESELTLSQHEGVSTIDESNYDQFHNQLLKNTRIRSLRISNSSVIPKSDSDKEYVSYEIEVATDQLTYCVWRRFREFYGFYKKIKKLLPKECIFPQKSYNIFGSSVSQSVIEERKIRLNLFLQDVLHFILTTKTQPVAARLFSFIDIKENYQQKIMLPQHSHKSFSEKGQFNRYYSLKPHQSLRKVNNYHENSLQMCIALINEPCNPSKHLKKLDEVIKSKKLKATNQEIKMIFMGFEDYQGVLKFSLSNVLESNRLVALDMLIDLVVPERNPAFERFERFIQKIPVEMWKIDDINFLESPIFKVHYFRLLKVYCDKAQKDHSKGEMFILKTLFMFHQHLVTDYLQWKDIQASQQNRFIANPFLDVDASRKIQIESFQTLELLQGSPVTMYYYEAKNVLIFILSSRKQDEQIKKVAYKWNRYTQTYNVEEFTGLFRFILKNQNISNSLRFKIEEQYFSKQTQEEKISDLLPEELQYPIKDIIENSDYVIRKKEVPFTFYSEMEEEIWVSGVQKDKKIALVLKTAKDFPILEGPLKNWAYQMAVDANNSF